MKSRWDYLNQGYDMKNSHLLFDSVPWSLETYKFIKHFLPLCGLRTSLQVPAFIFGNLTRLPPV